MATDLARTQPARESDDSATPYPPSWLDRLMNWVDRLPIPAWAFYLSLTVVSILLVNTMRWLETARAVGTLDLVRSFGVTVGFYCLALMHYLDRTAGIALDAFRSELALNEVEYSRLRHEFTIMPAHRTLWLGVVAIGLGLGLMGFFLLTESATRAGLRFSLRSDFLVLGMSLGQNIFVVTFLYHTVRQLVMVHRIYAAVAHINLYQLEPVYALSNLTARTSVGFLLILYVGIVVEPRVVLRQAPVITTILGVQGLALVTFVAPLMRMHQMLAREKKRLTADANRRLDAASAELYRRLDAGDLASMDGLNKGIASLIVLRDDIAKIPTWPWQPGTFRGVLSVLVLPILLPVALWLIQRILERLVVF
ncbi:MAG: hypothetical protein IT330_01845 [Anaerolineae bacterium]|nr:hypothetical protein [Anaerolineae bacterium]